ncbi:hypothetical protein [Rhodococcus sp. UNC363MFTsu5.1]|nr:hypothetical protein [Rhodococcus sp. UNC363MFTsu5.1]
MEPNLIRVTAVSALRGIVPTPIHAELVAEWQADGREIPAEVAA